MYSNPEWAGSIHHDGSPLYVSSSAPVSGEVVRLRLRAGVHAPIEQLFVRTAPDGEQAMLPMTRIPGDDLVQWWEGELRLTMPRTHYRFFLLTPDGGWWLTAAGMARHTPTDATDFKILADHDSPTWVRDSIFYQIFPDRFADGDPSNNVRDGEYLCYGAPVVARDWSELPQPETGGREFYGGDLQGIIERLPYLEELGVNAIYLNPVFLAPSNHKYDIADYERVDPHFGGDEALAALREELDARGMRLMLDVVPNHCGSTHHWFLDAQADARAPTAEFFTFTNHPNEYDTWLGVRSLPKLDYRSERLRDVMYAGADAIMRKWMRPPYRIDGWRIDVANMLGRQGESQLGHKIGRGIRRAVKAENPECYLLGENFFDGTPHLQGEELDASMNYRGFGFPLLQWLGGFDFPQLFAAPWADTHPLPTEALGEQWRAFLAAVPWQIASLQFNLVGSHDTPRVLAVAGGSEALARVAAGLLFTFPGVPSIYYGDEVGLSGGRDPENRSAMPWDPRQWNLPLQEFYRAMIALRRSAPALREGGFQLLHARGETIAFLREAPSERMVVVARRAAESLERLPVERGAIADGTRFRDYLTGTEAIVEQGHLPVRVTDGPAIQIWRSAG